MDREGTRAERSSTPLRFALLASCGLAFATRLAISKAALDAGVGPFELGIIGNLGAALLLSAGLAARGERVPLTRRCIHLYLVLGVVSVALPTVLSLSVVARVGPAYAATVYALSPMLTMGFAAGAGVERMTPRRSAGIAVGLVGMLVLVRVQLAAVDLARPAWVAVGLLVPACAALGNVIRSAFWPRNASTLAFACATLLTSSAVLMLLAPAFSDVGRWSPPGGGGASMLCALVLVSTLSYLLNFWLQRIAGPVVFSQIGYWNTGFGVLLAALLFGDVPTATSMAGVGLIAAGGVLASHRRA